MRRQISLYIGNMLADLDDESFVLLNLRQDDLGNPTVVRNSFTQQITLRGTDRNNAIFGHFYRVDRAVNPGGGNTGPGFDPSRKTPFKIYNTQSEIIMAGYVKLDNVVRTLNRVDYKVTLYGGLGSFLYSLHYTESGDPKSLASLDYLGSENPDGELDFTINAQTVRAAWNKENKTLSYLSRAASSRVKNDGTITTGTSTYYADDYIISGFAKIWVTGYKGSGSTIVGAAILNTSGTVLATYVTGSAAQAFANLEITVPAGGVTLRLGARNVSGQQAIVRTPDPRWNVLSFAPCYNGIPENFSADKAIGDIADYNLPLPAGYHFDMSGYSLFNLTRAFDEWEIKDLRSYLQRPVLSMRAFLDAICRPQNNGGYSVDYSDISGSDYVDTWLTLPMLPSLTPSKQTGGLSLDAMVAATGRKDIIGTVPAGSEVSATIGYMLNLSPVGMSGTYLYSGATNTDAKPKGKQTAFFIQVVAYNSSDVAVGGSTVRSWYDYPLTAERMAEECNFIPEYPAEFEDANIGIVTFERQGSVYSGLQGSGAVTALNVAYYKVVCHSYTIYTVTDHGLTDIDNIAESTNPLIFASYTSSAAARKQWADAGTSTISLNTGSFIRSDALITKAMLLSTSRTPADYLLSFCKTFGLYMVVDEAEKAVTILGRNSLYRNAAEDMTRRIDLARGLDITPLAFDAKWYDFSPEVIEGAFAKEYRDVYGIPYGLQRVNTGYDFNAEARNLLDGTVFKAPACILRRSKYYVEIMEDDGGFRPSPWLDKGNTYTLYNDDGETSEFPIDGPSSAASVDYLNPTYPGYDAEGGEKPEFAAVDNKAMDGTDVLLFWDGEVHYPWFGLTDDLPEMDTLNGGPCWILYANGQIGEDIPHFTRYKRNGSDVDLSLDFGRPKELGIPGINYPDSATIYRHCWGAYLADKYDRDTKVLKCRVDLAGMPVNRDLLRQFYYFGGSEWVLNAIVNHSMTTFDLTECEFVQVQDKDAYLNGQNL